MRTTKPISTISYNTLGYHIGVLGDLLSDHTISFYAIVPHDGEPDEVDDDHKDHMHCYYEPARLIQTEELRDLFNEPDPHNDKPLRCQPFRPSKWADWYLYGIHDPAYLASKGLKRAYAYRPEDIITSDPDYMHTLIQEIDTRALNRYMVMMEHIRDGHNFAEYMVRENIDVRYTHQYERAYHHLEYMYEATPIHQDPPTVDQDQYKIG